MANAAVDPAIEEETAELLHLPSLSARVEWFEDWEEATRSNRKLAIQDRQYYDNYQLTAKQINDLKDRGQPPIVKNRIARKVNFILGEEIRKRVNPAARPRTPQQEDDSEAVTDALRFVADEEHFDECRSAVTKNLLIEGYGGALKELEEDGRGGYKSKLRHIEWDRLAYDQHSRAPDFGDASWRAIVEWVDLKDAIAAYPESEQSLKEAINSAVAQDDDSTSDSPRGWTDKNRERIQIVEMFAPIGQDYYRFVFTQGADIVEPAKTWLLDEDGQHSVCPLTMVSCYVDKDGNRYGVVRQLISPQDMVNKAASKTLHALNVNQVISEDAAITDPDKFMEELAKPDGFATGVRPNGLKDGSVIIKNGMEIAQGHVAFMQASISDLDSIGPTAANIPELPNSASGIAFQRRQQAASQELGTIFDYLRSWQRRVFELDWLTIRHPIYGWTEEKWLRITDDQELTGYRFVGLNLRMTRAQRLDELLKKTPPVPLEKAVKTAAGEFSPLVMAQAQQLQQQRGQQVQAQMQQAQQMAQAGQLAPEQLQQMQAQVEQMDSPEAMVQLISSLPLMQEPVTVNQVAHMLVDIVLDESPDTATLAQEEHDNLTEMAPTILQTRPDIAPTFLKMWVKSSQLPNKRELLQELDKEPDPQQAQMQQQQQQMQQQMNQLQLAMQQATIAVEQTKAALQQAQTEKTAAETQKISVETQIAPAKAEADIASAQSQAMSHAANAGAKTGAASVPQEPQNGPR